MPPYRALSGVKMKNILISPYKFNHVYLAAMGKPFIANHDFIQLAKNNLPMRHDDPAMLSVLY